MTIGDLVLNITDRYKMPNESEEYQKTTDMYKKDFGYYSQSKLEKVWYAIKRYHHTNFAPNYSAIANCMDKAGIGEQREESDALTYQRCTKCGAKYVMGVSCCPKCNKYLKMGDNYMNDVEIVKCQEIPQDVIFCRQACPICPIFRNSTQYPTGIKCDCFQGEMRGEIKDCDNCKCKDCCLDLGGKDEGMSSGALMTAVRDCIKRVGNKPTEFVEGEG
jgi:hypothetical protein